MATRKRKKTRLRKAKKRATRKAKKAPVVFKPSGLKLHTRMTERQIREALGKLLKKRGVVIMTTNPKAPLGDGKRFRSLVRQLKRRTAEAKRKGRAYRVRDPKALAAWIGRRKYGSKKFQQLAARGRWRAKAARASRRKKAANPTRRARIARQLKRCPKSDALRKLREMLKRSRRPEGQKKRRRQRAN